MRRTTRSPGCNWDRIGDDGRKLTEFVRELTKLRKAQPLLRRDSWRDGMVVEWLNPAGGNQTDEAWNDAGATTIGLRLARDIRGRWLEGGAGAVQRRRRGDGVRAARAKGEGWSVVIDTAAGDRRRARRWRRRGRQAQRAAVPALADAAGLRPRR